MGCTITFCPFWPWSWYAMLDTHKHHTTPHSLSESNFRNNLKNSFLPCIFQEKWLIAYERSGGIIVMQTRFYSLKKMQAVSLFSPIQTRGFPDGTNGKQLPMQETQETWVRSLGGEDPWRSAWQLNSSILTWRIPWTEKPGGLQCVGSPRIRHDWSDLAHIQPRDLFYN